MDATSLINSLKRFVRENPKEVLVVAIILIVGAFLRLYRIGEYMTFLGDEGRDVIVVRRLLVYADPILIGPGTSIGNMYLGPLYYYMMAPALLLANFSPVGPAVQVAILGVLTILLIWYVAKKWFGIIPAILAAALYAISPTAIIFSRASWNPNIMPFFALASVFSIWNVWKEKNYKWLIVLGVSFAFVLNSHYLGILLLPIILVYWFLSYRKAKESRNTKYFWRYTIYSILIFAFLMSPLLIFDIRHNFQNFRAMREFITNSQSGSFKGIPDAIMNVSKVFDSLFIRLPGGRNESLGIFLSIFSIFLTGQIVMNLFKKKLFSKSPIALLMAWILIGVFGLAFVQRDVYDHYMGFLFPAPYLLLASLTKEALGTRGLVKKTIAYCLLPIAFIFLVLANLLNSPLKDNPPRQLQRSKAVSDKILSESQSKKFNLAVLAESNYEDGYRYFLEVNGAEVLHADIWDKNTISNELFVVCEKPAEKCDPTHSSKAEIVNFGWTKIDNSWEINGVMLYRLGHFKPN